MMPPEKMVEIGDLMASALAAAVAAQIVQMLKDDLQKIPNVDTGRAVTSFEQNQKSLGVWHAIRLIESKFDLTTVST